jgi:hypothetical protein
MRVRVGEWDVMGVLELTLAPWHLLPGWWPGNNQCIAVGSAASENPTRSRGFSRATAISLSLSRRRESERSDPKENESGVVTTRLHYYSRFSILNFFISSPSQSSSPSSPDPSGGGVRTGLSWRENPMRPTARCARPVAAAPSIVSRPLLDRNY